MTGPHPSHEALGAELRALAGLAADRIGPALERLGPLLDRAAEQFAAAVTGADGVEGTMAFVQKRKPKWLRTLQAKG